MDKNSHGQGGEENAGERGITAAMVVVGNRARGHGVVATKKKIEGEENSMGSGLISPVVITPDTLKLAPDAPAAHRTRTQRVSRTRKTTGRSPSVLCYETRTEATPDAPHQTRSGHCARVRCVPYSKNSTPDAQGASGAASAAKSGALSALDFQRDFARLSPNQVPTHRRLK